MAYRLPDQYSRIYARSGAVRALLLKYRHFTSNPDNWCNRLWLLKKSIFLKTTKIWGLENV
jgi:hypothetical protein